MSQVQPLIEPELVPFSAGADPKRSRLRIPGWLSLLLSGGTPCLPDPAA